MGKKKMNHPKGEYSVHYDSRNHLAVMTQIYGSVWPHIWHYCVLNVGITLFDYYILDSVFANLGIKITDKGHSISIFFVSFLIVTRVNMALARYNQARSNLASMFEKSRDLVTSVVIQTKSDQGKDAKEWRNDVAYYTCLLLRLSMAVFDFDDEKVAPWSIPALHGQIKAEILKGNQFTGDTKQWAHEDRTMNEEVSRVPITMSNHLRCKIQDHTTNLDRPLSDAVVNRFHGIIDGYLSAFDTQRKLYTTPMPFPLVQMARTMMFMWVFTLPFGLASDQSTIIVHCIVIFLLTFAFMGVETVSLQLDDPFGEDENDLDNLGMAKMVFEDIYNVVAMVDGPASAHKIRCNMQEIKDSISVIHTEQTPLV